MGLSTLIQEIQNIYFCYYVVFYCKNILCHDMTIIYHLCISSTANRCFSTVVPQCPWGIDSRISIDTVIHRCASSFCTSIPCFSFCSALFYCTSQILQFFFFFYKLKVCGNPALTRSVDVIFPNSICSLPVSVSCFGLVILAIFQTLLFFTMLVMVICNQ